MKCLYAVWRGTNYTNHTPSLHLAHCSKGVSGQLNGVDKAAAPTDGGRDGEKEREEYMERERGCCLEDVVFISALRSGLNEAYTMLTQVLIAKDILSFFILLLPDQYRRNMQAHVKIFPSHTEPIPLFVDQVGEYFILSRLTNTEYQYEYFT